LLAQFTSATISGAVVDPIGHPIQGADVEILNIATGVSYAGKSNETGIYTVSILPPGEYRVQVSKVGFKTLTTPDVILNVQTALALNFSLPIGATSESVTVEAGSSLMNTTDASVSTVIDRKFVENAPLNGRSFQDLISMTPGVVTQSPQTGGQSAGSGGDFSINGQRTESNSYMVDGVSANTAAGIGSGHVETATGGSIGASTALGTTQSLLSVDALQEFRVSTSTYSAEYGHGPGGQLSFLTRSGTDAIHGSVFDYLRNSYFDANDWFNNHYGLPLSALRQNDFGGTIGGPIVIPKVYDGHGKSFFFVSYEGLRLTQPQAASVQFVPDNYLREQAPIALQAILSAFPKPTSGGIDYGTPSSPGLAEFIQSYSLPSQIDSTSIRVDQALSHRVSAFFRYGDTPSSSTSRILSSTGSTNFKNHTYTLGLTDQFSAHSNDEFRLGFADSHAYMKNVLDSFGGAVPVDLADAEGAGVSASAFPLFFLDFIGVGSSYIQTSITGNELQQWNVVNTFSVLMGAHALKFGVDYRRIRSSLNPPSPMIEPIFFSASDVLNNAPTETIVSSSTGAVPLFNEFAGFAQDEWRVNSRLSVSLGLRWEVNPPPTGENGQNAYTISGNIANSTSWTLAPRDTPLWNTAWYNFAPRLGAAWLVHKNAARETVFRAGGGVFFDTDNQTGALGFNSLGFSATQVYFGSVLPLTPEQADISPSVTPPYSDVFAFPKHLQLPYTLQWNASLEQALGNQQSLTLSYVGSNGRRQVGQQELALSNSAFEYVNFFTGGISSNYQSLQAKLQRSIAHGIQGIASYTWSHSIDYGSTYQSFLPLLRGNSDFDLRNNFSAGWSWDIPSVSSGWAQKVAFTGWALDGRFTARSGFPVVLRGNFSVDPATGANYYTGVDLVPNTPIYLYGSEYPGGRAVNSAAFTLPAPGAIAGNAPRNFVRGFGATQFNLAVRREIGLYENLRLQCRAEAFNLLNHPDFGYIDPILTDATFGQATQMLNQSLGTVASQYQQGGPRSLQFALKLLF
jgi:hypothetical protein